MGSGECILPGLHALLLGDSLLDSGVTTGLSLTDTSVSLYLGVEERKGILQELTGERGQLSEPGNGREKGDITKAQWRERGQKGWLC